VTRRALGFRICILRHRSGVSQEDFAAKCGWTRKAQWAYEAGRRSPPLEAADTICKALDCTVTQLLRRPLTVTKAEVLAMKRSGLRKPILREANVKVVVR